MTVGACSSKSIETHRLPLCNQNQIVLVIIEIVIVEFFFILLVEFMSLFNILTLPESNTGSSSGRR